VFTLAPAFSSAITAFSRPIPAAKFSGVCKNERSEHRATLF
jgi:hypothetical protein